MAIDLAILKESGYSQKKLQKIFEGNPEKYPEKIVRLINRQSDRIRQGVLRSLEDAKYYRAIDDAFDLGQRQISITMMRGMIDRKASGEEVMKAATDWGLGDMIVDVEDSKGRPIVDPTDPTKTRTIKRLDIPVFFNVFIPLVMAYVKIRAAYLFNERDVWPPYKYEPEFLTLESRVSAELLTKRVTRMYQEMGMRNVDRQSILAMLQYGWCANFPLEPFFQEKQKVKKDGKTKDKTIREGIRYDIPHPTKCFWDEAWPTHTLNTDTGCSYVGHWKLQRYADLEEAGIWNKNSIQINSDSWINLGGIRSYAAELYPCALKLPTAVNSGTNVAGREDKAFTYSANDKDRSVGTAVIFEKLNPKEEGLYDYDGMVWHRFVYAGDRTVIACEPFAYAPGPFYLYDHDANRWRNSTLVSELLPFQDHISNLFTQYLIAVKNNLDNVTFWSRSALTDDDVKKIQNLGEKRFRKRVFIPFEPRELLNAQTGINQAFFSPDFRQMDTGQILGAVETAITMLERTLGFSSQELGAASQYKASAAEVNVRAGASSTRINYTGGFIDDATHAKKQRIYDAIVAYSTDDLFALVADLSETDISKLKEYGFEIEKGPGASAGVKLKPELLSLDSFISQREGHTRATDSNVAASMINIFQMIFSNEMLVNQIGVKNLMKRFNEILTWAGVPGDWRFDDTKLTGDAAKDTPEAQAQVAGMEEAVAKIIKPVVDGVAGRLEQDEQAIGKVAQDMQQMQQQTEEAVKQLGQGVQSANDQTAQLAVGLGQKLQQLEAAMAKAVNELQQEIVATRAVQTAPVVMP